METTKFGLSPSIPREENKGMDQNLGHSDASMCICSAKVVRSKGMYLYIQLDYDEFGRVHISEVEDGLKKEGTRPFSKFPRGQILKVRVLDVSTFTGLLPLAAARSHRVGKRIFDCTLRPSCLAGGSIEQNKEFACGDKVIGFVSEVTEDGIYMSLGQNDFGKVLMCNLSTKLKIVAKHAKNFKMGHGYTATVLGKADYMYLLALIDVDALQTGSQVVGQFSVIRYNMGMFLKLPLHYTGWACLTDISDRYEQADQCLGKVANVDGKYYQCHILDVDPERRKAVVSLRESRISNNSETVVIDKEIDDIEDVHINDEVRGFVSTVTARKVYVALGRHVTAIADIDDDTPTSYTTPGNVVELKVTRIDSERRLVVANLRLGEDEGGMDPTEFVPGTSIGDLRKRRRRTSDSEDESSASESETKAQKTERAKRKREESARKPVVSYFEPLITDQSLGPAPGSLPHLQVSSGFVWDADAIPEATKADSSSDSEDEENKNSKKKSKRHKVLGEKLAESKLFEIEKMLMDSERQPETADDYDRLILSSPNSSIIYMNYMTFHLQSADVDKARAVAERALKTISFRLKISLVWSKTINLWQKVKREEQEKLNIWVALLNLENLYGTPETLHAVFQRALQYNEPIKVYNHLVTIYTKTDKLEAAEQLYNTMVRRFKDDKDVWLEFGAFLMRNGRSDFAHKLMERSLKCLPNKEHVNVISKFAQLEFKFGEAQRGMTMMESILSSYPKRTDVWSVYIDMISRVVGDLDETRHLFERIITMKLSTKKMKFFFKRYLEFEKQHGTSETVSHVKEKAQQFVENNDAGDGN